MAVESIKLFISFEVKKIDGSKFLTNTVMKVTELPHNLKEIRALEEQIRLKRKRPDSIKKITIIDMKGLKYNFI